MGRSKAEQVWAHAFYLEHRVLERGESPGPEAECRARHIVRAQ